MKSVNELALLILWLLLALFMIHLIEGSGWSWIQSKFFTNYQMQSATTGGGQTGGPKTGINALPGAATKTVISGGDPTNGVAIGTSAGVAVGSSIRTAVGPTTPASVIPAGTGVGVVVDWLKKLFGG